MITSQSHQTHRRIFLAVNPGLATVCASRCRKWPIFHRQSPSASKTGRFCCDSEAIRMHPYKSNLLQMVYNGLVTHAQLLADATMPVSFDKFSDFIAIFDDRSSGPWRIFDHLCTRTKTLKPSLCGENGNCIGSINCTINCACKDKLAEIPQDFFDNLYYK